MPSRARNSYRALAIGLAVTATPFARAQVSGLTKGQAWFLKNGLQLQALSTNFDPFDLGRMQGANYTTVNWLWDSNVMLQGNSPWARWVRPPATYNSIDYPDGELPPLDSNEAAKMGSLIALSLGDEPNLNDAATRQSYIDWFNRLQNPALHPELADVLLYMNNYGGQVTDGPLGDFISRAHPDMISFDTYPYRYNAPNDPTPVQPLGGSPTNWYGDLRRYREHAVGNNIPLGIYRQTYHSTSEGVRDPSESELRLMTFAGLAFNAKYITDFTYNSGASPMYLYAGNAGGNATFYNYVKEANRQAANLGPALVRLKPVTDSTAPNHTSNIMFVRGQNTNSSTYNSVPIGFVQDPSSVQYTDWTFGVNDPYLSGFTTVTNLGTKNLASDGVTKLRGDMIVSWFKPSDEWFDGDDWNNEVYMMVVNGLADMNGTAADCRQSINLDFNNSAATQTLQVLDPNTGAISDVALPLVSTKRRYTLTLDGGSAVLFKFKDGAPFVGTMPADAIWTNSSSGNFQTGSNWDIAAAPGAGNFIHFGATTSGLGPTYTATLASDLSVKGAFVHRDNVTWNLNGKTLTLSGFSGVDSLIVGMKSGETGSLTIINGTLNVAGNGSYLSEIGKASGAVGVMTLGSGATWDNTPDLTIGKLGSGSLNINTGANASLTNAYVGGNSISAGGTGTINVAGGSVNISSSLKLWNGSITESSGSLNAVTIVQAGGSFARSGGVLSFSNYFQSAGTSSLGAISGNASISLSAATMTVSNMSENTVIINAGGRLNFSADGSSAVASKVGSLMIAGGAAPTGTMNLNDGALVIDYTGGSPLATIAAQIKAGFGTGQWNGPGITSAAATAVAADSSNPHKTAIGFAEASDVYSSFPAAFVGQSVDSTSLLLRYTLCGDNDLSGTVDSVDFNLLAANFGATARQWRDGDYNNDNTVNTVDFNLLVANFGSSLPAAMSQSSSQLVPEPTMLSLVVGACMIASRRRSNPQ